MPVKIKAEVDVSERNGTSVDEKPVKIGTVPKTEERGRKRRASDESVDVSLIIMVPETLHYMVIIPVIELLKVAYLDHTVLEINNRKTWKPIVRHTLRQARIYLYWPFLCDGA